MGLAGQRANLFREAGNEGLRKPLKENPKNIHVRNN